MDPFVIRFIRSSLIWLAVGAALGLWMIFDPAVLAYRPAHMHANLLGFVSMMIFGVAYHVIPRFSGSPLASRRNAGLHVWVANAGLALMVGGFMLRIHEAAIGGFMLRAGGVLSATGIALFITNIWQTLNKSGMVGIHGLKTK
jgi:heme/copper-type cytochrome/quinol oxidase subunit 1